MKKSKCLNPSCEEPATKAKLCTCHYSVEMRKGIQGRQEEDEVTSPPRIFTNF